MTDIQHLLMAQRDLQIKMGQPDPRTMSEEQKALFIKDMVLAATDELHELLAEVGWKPWATSRHVNRDAAVGEWIDLLHFVLNLGLALNLTGEEVFLKYMSKRQKNIKRQEEGYDGVTTKCPGCGRALDDDAVKCFKLDQSPELTWCERKDNTVNEAGITV